MAVHLFQKTDNNAHTQSGTFNVVISLFVQSFIFREKSAHFLGAHTDSGIGNLDSQPDFTVVPRNKTDREGHAAFFRILNGIGQKIDNDLLNTKLIAEEHGRTGGVHLQLVDESLFFQLYKNQTVDIFN